MTLRLCSRLTLLSGAKHLYLLDFDKTNLPELKATIEKKYPDVRVGAHFALGWTCYHLTGGIGDSATGGRLG